MTYIKMNNSPTKLNEGLENGDLKRLVKPLLEIDVYNSKMGEDSDICVVGFIIKGKLPATDLENFIEKGYDFVLDADVSKGEDLNGNYQVFVEIERSVKLPSLILKIVRDVLNLTHQAENEWQFKYFRGLSKFELSDSMLRKHVFLTPEEYKIAINQDHDELESLKHAAGIKHKSSNKEHTDDIKQLQSAAGII